MNKLQKQVENLKKLCGADAALNEKIGKIVTEFDKIASESICVAIDSDRDFLLQLSEDIEIQDNKGTEHPLFCVYQTREVVIEYGASIPNVRKSRVVYVDKSNSGVIEEEQVTNYCKDNQTDESELTRMCCVDVAEFVTTCLTQKDADKYIDTNGYNMRNPFVRIETMGGSPRMVKLYHILKRMC